LASVAKSYQLDAALRIILRSETVHVENDDWPELIDIATRVVLAADHDDLRRALFDAPSSSAHSFAGKRPARRERRRMSRLPMAMLAAGAALIAVGLNLVVGPSALLLKDVDAGLPALIGNVSLLLGLGAGAWALAQLAVTRSYRANESGNPPRVIALGLPLGSSLVVVALALSVAAASGPLAGGRPVVIQPSVVRQTPGYVQALQTTPSIPVVTSQTDPARPSLLQASALLIRDVSRRVPSDTQTATPSAITTTGLVVTPTPSPVTVTQPESSPAPNTTFARVSDSSSGDAVDSHSSSVVIPASVQIHLAPPPTQHPAAVATPHPVASATPPRGPAASAPPGLPAPPPPVFSSSTPSAPAVRH
jgi:uncharacterized membrane-anchored protein